MVGRKKKTRIRLKQKYPDYRSQNFDAVGKCRIEFFENEKVKFKMLNLIRSNL